MKRCTLCRTTFESGRYCPKCATFILDEDSAAPAAPSRPPAPAAPAWTPPPQAPGPAGAGAPAGPWSSPTPGWASGPGPGPGPGFAPGPADGFGGELRCRQCGGAPAAPVAFRQGIGMILMRRTLMVNGPLCRSCGQHHGRSMLVKTLLTGWWGIISFFFNFGHVFADISGLSRLRSLPEPQGGNPAARLDPGPPLHLRPAFYGVVALLLGLLLFVFYPRPAKVSSSGQAKIGQCVVFTGTTPTFVSCSAPHGGKVVAAVTDEAACPSASDSVLTSNLDKTVLCVDEDG